MTARSRLARLLRRFAGDGAGNVLPIVGLAAIPLLGAAGLAIDSTRAFLLQDQLQKALDAAGLASDQTTAQADATNFFNANFAAATRLGAAKAFAVSFSSDGLQVMLSASAQMPTTFMRILGINQVNVSAQTVITRQTSGLEVALVLDNTYSMTTSNKIGALKSAVHQLLDILYGSNDTVNNLWVSVVPFIAAVNVGTANTAFLKSGDRALGTASAFSPDPWGGCVKARYSSGSTYDRTDDPPSVAPFSSYLYPYTADSYPGLPSIWSGFYVNVWATGKATPATRKYTAYTGGVPYWTGYGPNVGCPTPITPLVASKATVSAAIDAMQPWLRGGAVINEGLVWGWRTISPRWRGLWSGSPSTLPFDYNTKNMKKAIVLVTDGDNEWPQMTYSGTSFTAYNAYGGQFSNVGQSTESGAEGELNNRTTTVCNNIKVAGITLYTMSVGTAPSATGKALLQACATKSSYYFDSPDSAALTAAFQTIGQQLSNLRIAQ
jgi:Flp pilus assembly protein TadG